MKGLIHLKTMYKRLDKIDVPSEKQKQFYLKYIYFVLSIYYKYIFMLMCWIKFPCNCDFGTFCVEVVLKSNQRYTDVYLIVLKRNYIARI